MDTRKTDAHAAALRRVPFALPDGRTPCDPASLASLFEKTNTTKAVIVPEMRAEGCHLMQSNEDVERMIGAEKDLFSSKTELYRTASLDPRMIYNSPKSDFSAYIKYYEERGCRGVGFVYANIPVCDPLMINLVSHAGKCKKTVCLEIGAGKRGMTDDENLSGLESLVSRFPETAFIVCAERSARLSLFPVLLGLCEKHGNLYADLSCLSCAKRDEKESVTDLIKSAVRIPGKVLYGSYVPAKEDMRDLLLPFVLDSLLSSGAMDRGAFALVCRENAGALFGI